MKYNIIIYSGFKKEFKALQKNFPSLKEDFEKLISNIETELANADDLGNGFKKIRFNIKSKGKGKSGGARIITYEAIVSINESLLIFASIYNKTDFESININVLKKNLGL